MKKTYERPALLLTTVQIGAYGQYEWTDRDEIYTLEIPDRHSSR
jgi:hypothetical protein